MKALFSHVKSVYKDNKLRKFYFKLLHRIVVTKKELFLFGKAEDTKCMYVCSCSPCDWKPYDLVTVEKCFIHAAYKSFK